jgi:hypothetical protein
MRTEPDPSAVNNIGKIGTIVRTGVKFHWASPGRADGHALGERCSQRVQLIV